MSTKKETQEPTMEEILASIRRIISEEGEEPKAESAPVETAEPMDEDVLELTDVVEESGPEPAVDDALELTDEVVEVAHAFAASEAETPESEAEIVPEPESEPEPQSEPEPIPPLEDTFELGGRDAAELADIVDPAEEVDAIMSPESGQKVSASFDRLSELLVAGYEGYDKTLEGMVREMLRPMLKDWLDQNLPHVVERVVAREIARLARVKKP